LTDVIEIFCSTGVMYKYMIYDLQNEYKQVYVLHLSKKHHVQFSRMYNCPYGILDTGSTINHG